MCYLIIESKKRDYPKWTVSSLQVVKKVNNSPIELTYAL